MKKWLVVGFLLFSVTLAVVAGLRLSRDSLAVVMGVLFGVAASIPTSLLILAVVRRSEARRDMQQPYGYPPVIIVSPGEGARRFLPPAYPTEPIIESEPRRFRIIGEGPEGWDEALGNWGGDD